MRRPSRSYPAQQRGRRCVYGGEEAPTLSSNPGHTSNPKSGGMMARAAVIGPEIHAKVTELVKGGMSKADAFKQIAKERKSSESTVSANYYRVQRQQAG